MELPLPFVVVEGTPAECGAAYGAQATDMIASNVATYLARFANQAGLSAQRVAEAGAEYRERTVRLHPRVAAMLDGVAEGAGVAVEHIYALNARTELLYGSAMCECTSIGVLDTFTRNGHTLLAQNWDWHPAQRPYTLLLATRDERGSCVVSLAEAGMLAKTGVNDAGLGVCVNMLTCDRDGTAGGVPYHVLLRAVMESRTLVGAIETACLSPRSASINLLIGQAFGDGVAGEIIDLELAPGEMGVLNPVDGILTHANHFQAPVAVHDALKQLGSSSFYRAARARRLLGPGPIGEPEIRTVLADHGGYPHAICRHDVAVPGVPEVGELLRSESIFSVVLDLDERRMAISAGPPCTGGGYHDVRLADIFADCQPS
jgi:isopenicillin-N N-acyltransferase like protein